ncbi:hypothetical protein FLAG1_11266 [Fusarium langsethiae]|uniref:Uncharacterized protein n=2 Tax=Fusarium sambucinum species complex TaxID=569360 RepID=A0A0M9EMX5_FUSLA|nr:hypothetical protein FLAG1_11266 [Fusarium langsethiae]RGP67569.1 hypothetical protein FSPOR_5756 [Fusarium sporotrichioides]GKU08510.1 unnamed protein product [Fusarium langsethiae]GKU10694.1 unnamed protein product [Fusarium langsethiae]
MSNVGYSSGDQHRYSKEAVRQEGRDHGVNTEGYLIKTKREMDDRMKHEPGFAAVMHGNKPSRGAKIDAELAREDAEQMAKKREKMDSMPGKKNEHHTDKNEWK